jgi:hypothetical protein
LFHNIRSLVKNHVGRVIDSESAALDGTIAAMYILVVGLRT